MAQTHVLLFTLELIIVSFSASKSSVDDGGHSLKILRDIFASHPSENTMPVMSLVAQLWYNSMMQ